MLKREREALKGLQWMNAVADPEGPGHPTPVKTSKNIDDHHAVP